MRPTSKRLTLAMRPLGKNLGSRAALKNVRLTLPTSCFALRNKTPRSLIFQYAKVLLRERRVPKGEWDALRLSDCGAS
jgi:hypothetical protein